MRLGTLVGRDLARSKRRLLVVALAVAGSVALLVLLGSVSLGLYRGVVQPLLPKLPLDLLKVEPRTVSVGFLAFDTSDLGGGLDADAVARLEKVDGVAKVYPVVGAGFPMRAEGGEGFIGRRMRTDVFATGVDPDLVKDDVAKGSTFERHQDQGQADQPPMRGEVVPPEPAQRRGAGHRAAQLAATASGSYSFAIHARTGIGPSFRRAA